ncbi:MULTISPECIES: hemin ABC transporter substrate-binding protein [Dickeya]|uniref:heme/hemin ABC transporter substrate-binding protein n=1 Tax=Dickeya TaxID=204037 RepID=UPI0003AA2933|nr:MULTISPECIES: hemin ABC transporter substrate-binding protein [Dickeya]UGA52315.1 hemin ABC transporter substrate-binding protein [Dickeya fangzhongdai]UWH08659.1 hemin ABC transporter substrate-binding protein [Dickeya fangzhongdai]
MRTLCLMLLWLPLSLLAADRVVTIGGDVTQIVFALQAGDKVVARDSTSLHPEAVTSLPNVGYMRQLNAEGILSMQPTLVLASALAQPSTVLEQVASRGVRVVTVPEPQTVDGIGEKIQAIAGALGVTPRGEALAQQVKQQLAAIPSQPASARMLFILSHSGMGAMAAGQDTAADAAFRAAGLQNAMQGFNRYQPLSQEGVVASQPDWVVITTDGAKSLSGGAAVWKLPGLALTPAGKHQRLLIVDDMALLGFGLDTPAALLRLRQAVDAAK